MANPNLPTFSLFDNDYYSEIGKMYLKDYQSLQITYPDPEDLTHFNISGKVKSTAIYENEVFPSNFVYLKATVPPGYNDWTEMNMHYYAGWSTMHENQDSDIDLGEPDQVSETEFETSIDFRYDWIQDEFEIFDYVHIYVYDSHPGQSVDSENPNGIITITFDGLQVVDEITEDEENEEESGGINPATHEVVISKAPLADFMRDSNNHSTIAQEWAEYATGVGIKSSALKTDNISEIINKISMHLNGIEIVDPNKKSINPKIRLVTLDPSITFEENGQPSFSVGDMGDFVINYTDDTHASMVGSWNGVFGMIFLGTDPVVADDAETSISTIAYKNGEIMADASIPIMLFTKDVPQEHLSEFPQELIDAKGLAASFTVVMNNEEWPVFYDNVVITFTINGEETVLNLDLSGMELIPDVSAG